MYCEKCGKYSGKYQLCIDCYNDNLIEYFEENDDVNDDDIYIHPGYCLTCGEIKNDIEHLFCSDCYKEYKNKEILISIIKGRTVKVHESRYYNRYKCTDGHYVKSKAEREIDEFLNTNGIRHYYEPEFPIDNDGTHSIHPDFYLPDKDVYIEYWGNNEDIIYLESMEYKLNIYRKKKITLICLYESTDSENIAEAITRKLKYYKKGIINGEQ